MIVNEHYIFEPLYPQHTYLPDGTQHRNGKVALWYAYLKWREELDRQIETIGSYDKVTKLFPKKEFKFVYNANIYKYLPDFEISYKGIRQKEYHSITDICGVQGKMFRRLFHKYPMLEVRVIEPLEEKIIIKNLLNAGIDLKEKIQRNE